MCVQHMNTDKSRRTGLWDAPELERGLYMNKLEIPR